MQSKDDRKRETEALIEAIWGPPAIETALLPDPLERDRQNKALAAALTAYLQQYLQDP